MTWGRSPRRWTPEEDERLRFEWGSLDIQTLADRFGRTIGAIPARAQKLGLGAPSLRTRTMDELVRLTGWSRTRIMNAAEALGIRLQHGRRTDPRQKKATADYAITTEQSKAIMAYLEEHAGVRRIYKAKGKRTTRGVWGIGIKPVRCRGCGRRDKPHYAKGKCQHCYMQQVRTKKQEDPWETPPDPWKKKSSS